MSSGGGAGGESRVSIPSSFRKTIQNIKEIAGNHSDEEVYAMLKECCMDPNETTQKLLFQDTFHVVKGKRYKRKENLGSKELSDAGWRAGGQGRGGRGSRGSFSSRFVANDAGGAKNMPVGKEMGANQGADKGSRATVAVQDSESKLSHSKSSFAPGIANGDAKLSCSGETHSSDPSQSEKSASPNANVTAGHTVLIGDACGNSVPPTKQALESIAPESESGVSASSPNTVSVHSHDKGIQHAVENIKYDPGSQQRDAEANLKIAREIADAELVSSSDQTITSNTDTSHFEGKLASKPQRHEANHPLEVLQVAPVSASAGFSESRPSSNYSNHSQPLVSQQKAPVGPSKEWKPKQQKSDTVKGFRTAGASEIVPHASEIGSQSLPSITANVLDDATSKIQKKVGELQFSDRGHVIFPNHIRVPEAERAGLSFGSFDTSFVQKSSPVNEADTDKGSNAETARDPEENVEETPSSSQIASAEVEEEVTSDRPQSPEQITEDFLSSEDVDVSSSISAGRELDQSKTETVLVPGAPASQYSVVQTVPTYSTFGLMAPVFGGQIASFENPEPQARDASRIPGIMVQQPIDLSSSFYTQLYRANADGDGRVSPIVVPGSTTKYNGHSTAVPAHTDPASQESGSVPVQPTSGPATISNQGAGVMPSAVTVQQHPVSIFRQPTGLHISHYPPNFIPYSQYFSPFYLPPPSIHPFLSNPAFPQQHPAGNMYPPPMTPAAAPIKFSLSQFKAGGNSGNSNHAGSTTGFGPYSSSLTNYNLTTTTSVVNSTGNEELAAPQYKENNMYLSGQQSEGPTVWIPAPGRDVSGLQASSFYNISPQGQPVAFTPVQGGHAAFPGIYHPTQTGATAPVHPLLQQSQAVAGAAEMVAPPTGVYQQPQRTQINWANNY